MLVNTCTTHVDIVRHLPFLVCFWLIQRLGVFWYAWRFAIEKMNLNTCTPCNAASYDKQILVIACQVSKVNDPSMHQLTRHCLLVFFWPTPPSPDLATCDFLLFPILKRPMKVRRFAMIEQTKSASLEELKTIPKSDYQKCFEDSKKRWHKCIWGGLLWRGQYRYWWINNFFREK